MASIFRVLPQLLISEFEVWPIPNVLNNAKIALQQAKRFCTAYLYSGKKCSKLTLVSKLDKIHQIHCDNILPLEIKVKGDKDFPITSV